MRAAVRAAAGVRALSGAVTTLVSGHRSPRWALSVAVRTAAPDALVSHLRVDSSLASADAAVRLWLTSEDGAEGQVCLLSFLCTTYAHGRASESSVGLIGE